MSLKLNEENEVVIFLDSLIEDDSSIASELVFLSSNIRRQICGVLDSLTPPKLLDRFKCESEVKQRKSTELEHAPSLTTLWGVEGVGVSGWD
jgi:hypothetical protein